tara:strand:- start:837 stop:1277 length:441 start_codon:yes stop_codon:yes gene_type:complete
MKRVQVYYNIRRGDYSVRQSGRVIDHVDSIILRDVRFNVAPAGRDKVRATGVKNVHATVTGYIDESVKISLVSLMMSKRPNGRIMDDFLELVDTDTLALRSGLSSPISYNPMRHDTFVKLYGAVPVSTARYVALRPNRQIRAWGVK